MNQKRILIMAGGTGGHVFPALAVANYLRARGWIVHWLGTKQGLEAKIVPEAGFPLHFLTITGLRRSGLLKWLLSPLRIFLALFQSLKVMHAFKPQVVLGMGGFAAGPGGLAAWLTRCPLIIHEQNAIPGFTNRTLSLFAKHILEGFPNAFEKQTNAIWTGNPVRETFMRIPPPKERFTQQNGALKLLVLGGSRGALALNQILPKVIQAIPVPYRPEIWHQTGAEFAVATEKAYSEAQLEAKVEPFVEDMAKAYEWADLVICRAGALTIAELATVGVGSILIPFPFAVDDHQTHNGRFLEKAGAALLIQQKGLTAEMLADIILELTQNKAKIYQMGENAYAQSRRDALSKVAGYCEEVISGK